jgi:hypothetical protein
MIAIKTALAAALLGAGLTAAGAQSFQGITCDDVRSLSSAERTYWSKRLNLSVEQRHLIYATCYHHARGGRHDLGERVVNATK